MLQRLAVHPLLRRSTFLFLALFALLVGFSLADDFGQTWDDPADANYGADALRAYAGSNAFLRYDDRFLYGPFHFMASELAVQSAGILGVGWHEVDIRHFMNYLTYLAGLVAFYILSGQLLESHKYRLGATALFATQPLLFGHGFINEKDIPFMSYFTLSVAVGWLGVARIKESINLQEGLPNQNLRSLWFSMKESRRITIIVGCLVLLIYLVETISHALVLPILKQAIGTVYLGGGPGWAQEAFARFATDAYKTPLNLYFDKVDLIYSWTSVLGLVVLGAAWGAYAIRGINPRVLSREKYRKAVFTLLAAGVILGLTTSIRSVGPYAGLIVMIYAMVELRNSFWLALLPYSVVAFVTSYLTWPYLWLGPFQGMLNSILVMSDFRPRRVFYLGEVLRSDELPWHYLPRLFSIQLTLPALLIIVVGCLLFIINRVERRRPKRLLLALWPLLPLLYFIGLGKPLYNSFRQLLFILPPLFLLPWIGLAPVLDRLRRPVFYWVLLIVVLVPAAYGDISLHPYQYSFFNQLAGGVAGADGKYETDYWCTSYREAIAYVNDHAGEGASVVVWGPDTSAKGFAREDLTVYAEYDRFDEPDFVLSCNRALWGGWYYSEFPVVEEIGRQGAVFANIRSSGGIAVSE